MRVWIVMAALALAAAGCGDREKAKDNPVQPAAAPVQQQHATGPLADQLRSQAGRYYFDFVREAGMDKYAAQNLGLTPEDAARFSRNMDIQGGGVLASANGVEALVFTGCSETNCGGGAGPLSVIAIDLSTGDAFVGVKDEDGETVLKSVPRLQMLLTETSPTNSWTNPQR